MPIRNRVRPIAYESLPEGYRRCEYLESTGEQWIITDVFSVDYIEADFIFQYTQITGARQLFGISSASPNFGITVTGNWEKFLTPADLDKHSLTMVMNRQSAEYYTVLDNTRKDGNAGDWWTGNVLWACNPFALDKKGSFPCCIRSYGAKVTDGNNLLCNLIPCLDDTGTPCMYDTVNRKPFYNQGASVEEGGKDFLYKLKGPAARKLPYGYYPLEYLESTGTQWIDTGVKLSNESEVRVTLYTEENDDHKIQSPYGWSNDSSKQFCCLSQYYHEQSQKYLSVFYLPKNFITSKARVIGKCDIIHNAEGFTVNGIKTSRATEFDPFETPESCRVFASSASNFLGRIYSFSISRAGVLQLDLQPCLNADGEPVMYDFVSGQDFKNQGTGVFLYKI